MKNLTYAEKRLNLLKDDMGSITFVERRNGELHISFTNGMYLQLHDKEISYQAMSYLESEIEGLKA